MEEFKVHDPNLEWIDQTSKVKMLGTRLLCVLVCVLLGFQCCCGLPVDRAQVKEKAPAQLDLQDYMSYWEEMARNDPGK